MSALHDAWMSHLESVRWFGGKGAGASIVGLEPVATHTDPDAVPAVRSEVATLAFPDGHTEYYHLLVALYPESEHTPGTVLGTEEADGRGVRVVDATTDPGALAAFVAATAPAFAEVPVAVWRGEQSNTTLTLGNSDLYKLFRRIEPGPNLDAEVLVALSGDRVPALRGRLTADWPAGHTTDLGIVLERIAGAEDGWERATAACVAGADFRREARDLGAALAEVHARLADAFGFEERSGDDLADTMASRLDAAAAVAPPLAEHVPALRSAFDALRGHTLAVQRVHGDFHLGQTLASPAGWTIIDFEGEPAKTAAERRAFDSPWRDVAGMVRSFDYARSAHPEPASAEALAWADAATAAFLDGYCAGEPPRADLLNGYVIDKAVYEVVYEIRNRPDWVQIPLRAVIAASVSGPEEHPLRRSDDDVS